MKLEQLKLANNIKLEIDSLKFFKDNINNSYGIEIKVESFDFSQATQTTRTEHGFISINNTIGMNITEESINFIKNSINNRIKQLENQLESI